MADLPRPSRSPWRATLAYPVPVLALWAGVVALTSNMPDAFYRLATETRLVLVLLVAVVAFATVPVWLERWGRWIDPQGRGAGRTPLADEIDNFAFMGVMMGSAVTAAYWNDWTGVRGWHLLAILVLFLVGVHGYAHRVRSRESAEHA
jgi:hypothetical protein